MQRILESRCTKKEIVNVYILITSRNSDRKVEQPTRIARRVELLGVPAHSKRPYGRFIEIKSNLRRKKLHRTNEGSNFPGGNCSNRNNFRASIPLRRQK